MKTENISAQSNTLSSTVEDYLKTIYEECRLTNQDLVPLNRIVSLMNVTPGTVTSMVKNLDTQGFVVYLPRKGCRLTELGNTLAYKVLRRHRIIELFLVEILGIDWSLVHEEADNLEHAVSEKILDRIEELLHYPKVDPHGDFIPTSWEERDARVMHPVSYFGAGKRIRIESITDESKDFLQFVRKNGLEPGQEIMIENKNDQAGTVTLKSALQHISLSDSAAKKILCSLAK